MRLRLRIERNELPPASIIWTIGDTELKQTVAQFLERVNERFPLEGATWGLEDYAVTLAGYEALHYDELGKCFQNEDEVVIKPLQAYDVRARKITGRNQISPDGRHVIDGVPFGRPLVNRSTRPNVKIPPRKKQKLDDGADDDQALVQFQDPSDLGQHDEPEAEVENDEDDEDFHVEDDDEEDSDSEMADEEVQAKALLEKRVAEREAARLRDEEQEERGVQSLLDKRAGERETANGHAAEDDSSDDSSSSDSDSDSSSDDSSDTSSNDSSDDSSDESWDGIMNSEAAQPSQDKPLPPAESPPDQQSSQESQPQPPKTRPRSASLPFQGKPGTQGRNTRRREQRRLKHLIQAGVLPEDARKADMENWVKQKNLTTGADVKYEAQRQLMEKSRERLLGQIASGGVDLTDHSHVNGDSGIDVGTNDSTASIDDLAAEAPPVKRRKVAQSQTQFVNSPAMLEGEDETQLLGTQDTATPLEVTNIPAASSQRRARLDAAGTNRLIFGSLGVRAPKTQEDRDALQKKLAARPKRTAAAAGLDEQRAGADDEDDEDDLDDWREKIELLAFECCDEGVTLSAPPFPFQQRWDPQYQYNKKKRQKSNKRKSAGGANSGFVETYDKYNTDGRGDMLDYDDVGEDELEDEYWEDGALLDNDYERENDGFPDLPADTTTLPILDEADAKQGDILAFEELACSAATSWQPKTIVKTVRLESGSREEGWHVKYAKRDLRPRNFDDEGNRIYSKFEMEGLSDDEEDEVEQTFLWGAMTNPRLLLRSE